MKRPKLQPLRTTALRAVEKQSRIATAPWCENADEQQRLEELIDGVKPPVPQSAENIHWLLRSSFRYPPLTHGSRFGHPSEMGVMYLSLTRPALIAEMAYYTHVFATGEATPYALGLKVERTVISVDCQVERCAHVSDLPAGEQEAVLAIDDWQHSQRLGKRVREASGQAIQYPCARLPSESAKHNQNLAIFDPSALRDAPKLVDSYTVHVAGDEVIVQGAMQEQSARFDRDSALFDTATATFFQ